MSTMRAVRAHTRGGAGQLRLDQAPRPEPRVGEALIRVHAAGITGNQYLSYQIPRQFFPADQAAIDNDAVFIKADDTEQVGIQEVSAIQNGACQIRVAKIGAAKIGVA